jgi:high affinity Mn2+ porin
MASAQSQRAEACPSHDKNRVTQRQFQLPSRRSASWATICATQHLVVGAIILSTFPAVAVADDPATPENVAVHGQATFTEQYHPDFTSPYIGHNSLQPGAAGAETFDATLFLGMRLWNGAEAWLDPEIDQGFGLSNTLGVAGFPSGEAYKVGSWSPYFRLQRAFIRQTVDLGGGSENVDPDANQLGGTRSKNNLILTIGKVAVTDIFDTNTYAHDPRGDFLNWSVIDSGAFDYAADAWGYSYGMAAEWSQGDWTLRAGLFDLSVVPNSKELETDLSQYEFVTELERRISLWGESGKVKLLGYVNRGRMGSYDDAIALGVATDAVPDTSLVRRTASRPGAALNIEQQINDDLGAFARLSWNDGSEEAYEFTEINHSGSVGLSLKGNAWNRSNDTVGIAAVVNGLSAPAQAYFADGGLGILIGDGRLPHYGTEDISELYYDAAVAKRFSVTLDYQYVAHPAYNRDRGPVSVLAARLHASF